MGMMGMFKWLRKDRSSWAPKPVEQNGLNNEAYRHALQAFIERRRLSTDVPSMITSMRSTPEKSAINAAKNSSSSSSALSSYDMTNFKNLHHNPNTKVQSLPGVPHVLASELFELGWIAGTEDRYLEMISAEWHNTRVSVKRHTHPECLGAVKADVEVLTQVRHVNVLLLMATTQTKEYGLMSIFESVDCTLYSHIHEQGQKITMQGLTSCGMKLSDALQHCEMRGFIHSAISSHCIFLTSTGNVKIGGWELSINWKNPNPERMYEERLRTEIYRWLAPELICGEEAGKVTDIYGLSVLIWEMCTGTEPWKGLSQAELRRQYGLWKCGISLHGYDFPPLLRKLLESGLHVDVNKRNLDFGKYRKSLRRIETEYVNNEPVCVLRRSGNNQMIRKNPVPKMGRSLSNIEVASNIRCTVTPKQSVPKSVIAKVPVSEPRQILRKLYTPKEASADRELKNDDTHVVQATNVLNVSETSRESVDKNEKNTNVLLEAQRINIGLNNQVKQIQNNLRSESPSRQNIYTRKSAIKEAEKTNESIWSKSTSALPNSMQINNSENEDSESARSSLNRLKQKLATSRDHFFSELNASSNETTPITSPKEINISLSNDKSNYQAHKPASHRTSLPPRQSKSPGDYDPSYSKSMNRSKTPYSQTPEEIKKAILQPRVLNADPQGFFETSLWRREKLICISKMSKNDNEVVASTSTTSKSEIDKLKSPSNNNSYTVDEETNEINKIDENKGNNSRFDLENADISHGSNTSSLQVLKEALDRATNIIYATATNIEQPQQSPHFINNISDINDEQGNESMFDSFCRLKGDVISDEIRSIEKTNNDSDSSDSFVFITHTPKRGKMNKQTMQQFKEMRTLNTEYESSNSLIDTFNQRSFNCESIAELSNESSVSSSKKETNLQDDGNISSAVDDKKLISNSETQKLNNKYTQSLDHDVSIVKEKDCTSCRPQIHLPRRRSLPAALCHMQTINNTNFGKSPTNCQDVRDSTVEDLYIDDEFGESLNVNMILINDEAVDDNLSDAIEFYD